MVKAAPLNTHPHAATIFRKKAREGVLPVGGGWLHSLPSALILQQIQFPVHCTAPYGQIK